MLIDDETHTRPPQRRSRKRKLQDVRVLRKKSEPRRYVSKHFNQAKPLLADRVKEQSNSNEQDQETKLVPDLEYEKLKQEANTREIVRPSDTAATQDDNELAKALPRICHGLNLDDLSSDSDLTDVPDEIGSDPFYSDDELPPPTVLRAEKASKIVYKQTGSGSKRASKAKTTAKTKPKPRSTVSPYFPEPPRHSYRNTFLATLPFPPISDTHFGLMQEKLAYDPYRLLLATIFLNKTPGRRAMPIFYNLMDRYPQPQDLADAEVANVTDIIRELGFQNQRARKCVELAKVWTQNPPRFGRRYRKLHYPVKGDGKDVKDDEILDDEDPRVAWEISHLPGLGPYSHDSWRMFCRDTLREKASDWLGNGVEDETKRFFEPEWKRVLPMDKELRAWMTWMWLKEGWVWNKETGERTKADEELMRLARGGGIVQEEKENDHLIVRPLEYKTGAQTTIPVEHPAGDFVP